VLDPLATALVLFSLALAVFAALLAALDRQPGKVLLQGLLGLQVALIVQLGVAVVKLLGGERPASLSSFVGYLIVSVLIVPLAMYWSLEERSRWSTLVLGAACLTVSVLVGRLLMVWSTVG
jgi:hypothetical protein